MAKKLDQNIENLETDDDEIQDQYDDNDYEDENEVVLDVDEDDEEDFEEEDDETSTEDKRFVPLSALKAERKKFKKQIADLKNGSKETNQSGFNESDLYDEYVEEFIDMGMTESTAKRKAEREVRKDKELYDLKKTIAGNNTADDSYDAEFNELLKVAPNAEDLREELIEEAERTGYSLKQVYAAVYSTDKKLTRDERMIIEQRAKARVTNASKKGIKVNQGNVRTKPAQKLNLTKDELAVAKSVNMTPSEYYAMKNESMTSETYRKMSKRK
jgi:hypothetical protein